MIRTISAYEGNFTGGVRTALADLNGDLVPDIVTAPGPGGGPRVRAFNGVTFEPILNKMVYQPDFQGGLNIAAGDIGHGEMGIVTAPDQGGGPHIYVMNANGIERRSFMAFDANYMGGINIALGYAANGNSAIFASPVFGSAPWVRTFETRTGNLLNSTMVYEKSFTGGISVAASDLTGDGVSDIITGPNKGGDPVIRAIDGQTGETILNGYATDADERSGVKIGSLQWGEEGNAVSVIVQTALGQRMKVFRRGVGDSPAEVTSMAITSTNLGSLSEMAEVRSFDGNNPSPNGVRREFTKFAATGPSNGPSRYSAYPVGYADGIARVMPISDAVLDEHSAGGARQFVLSNEQQFYNSTLAVGMTYSEIPVAQSLSSGSTIAVTDETCSNDEPILFDQSGGTYTARGPSLDVLEHDSTVNVR